MLSLWVLLLTAASIVDVSSLSTRSQRDAIGHAMRTIFDDPGHPTCPGCAGLKAEVPETELADLRIEFIKQQILKKLKLKEVPKVSPPVNKLPIPILTKGMYENTISKRPDDYEMQEDDDFFGKTNQVVLFPEESSNCADFKMADTNHPTACFTFHLPKDLDMDDIATSNFWVFKQKDFLDGDFNVNQTFTYLETPEADRRRGKFNVFERHATKIEEGWVILDVVDMVRKWLKYNQRRHTIQVMCETCGFTAPWTPVSIETKNRPFLEINTETNRKKKRPKRNVNCSPGVSECCRDKLYISFADIGWGDWIIQPRGYEAYFCRGSCSNAASLTLSGSAYSSVIQKLSRGGKKLELVPCCTATHLSSIQLIYMDNNETITQKTLPNMVVDTCGCM